MIQQENSRCLNAARNRALLNFQDAFKLRFQQHEPSLFGFRRPAGDVIQDCVLYFAFGNERLIRIARRGTLDHTRVAGKLVRRRSGLGGGFVLSGFVLSGISKRCRRS